jgi:hypothetical protein
MPPLSSTFATLIVEATKKKVLDLLDPLPQKARAGFKAHADRR